MSSCPSPSTGLPALDAVVQGLRAGDNVVWQVESLDDYARLVRPRVLPLRITA